MPARHRIICLKHMGVHLQSLFACQKYQNYNKIYEMSNERKKSFKNKKTENKSTKLKWDALLSMGARAHRCIISLFVLISNYVQNIFIFLVGHHTTHHLFANVDFLEHHHFHWVSTMFVSMERKIKTTTPRTHTTENMIVIIR